MSYTCPDCEDGILEPKFRRIELELKDGEKVEIVGDVVLISSVACNNGCSADDEEEEDKPKTKRKKRTPTSTSAAFAGGDLCQKTGDCDRPDRHRGLCNHNGKAEEEVAGVQRCTRSDECSKPYAHTGACNKMRQAEE